MARSGILGLHFGAIALATLSAACASTGAVPKPFPTPGSTASPRRPATPVDQAASDLTPHPFTRPDLYALVGTALELRGVRYYDGGADPAGFDCSGFTQYVFARHGLALPREVRDQFRTGKKVQDDLAPGDLLFFATTEPGPSHVAIAIGRDEFIHAPSSTGVVRVERLSALYWSRRFVGARRIE